MDEQTTISTKKFLELVADQNKLYALEGAGVDNWEGYDDAMQSIED